MKHIVLIDYSLDGHHLSFLVTFSNILAEQGNMVYVLVPESEKLLNAVLAARPESRDRIRVMEFYPKFANKNKGDFATALSRLKIWRYEASVVKKLEKLFEFKSDLVFYAWLDNQLARFIPARLLDMIFPRKWSGLYFHPYHLRETPKYYKKIANWRDFDSIFLSKNCIGVTIHDPGILEGFSFRIGKPVIHFPETADDTAPDFNYPVYKEIKEKAKGRFVVGMVGCEIHKGTITLINIAKKIDPDKYFFCFLGKRDLENYNPEDRAIFENFIAEQRENCYFYSSPIPEGSAYNAVFCAFDIPFLIYNNFISSSNRLTKAAIFHRLVLAQDNFCVGEDVKNYNLGETAQPQNVEAAELALNQLTKRIETKNYPLNEWEEYARINGISMLKVRFQEILDLL